MEKRIGWWMLGLAAMVMAVSPLAVAAPDAAGPIGLPQQHLLDIPILDGVIDSIDDLLNVVDGLLSQVIGALPVPILGPDSFEYDNTADDANFVQLLVADLVETLADLLPFLKTHNFHTADDADWHQFYADAGQLIVVQTFNLYPGADTFLTVYQPWDEEGLLPTTIPAGCTEAFISTDAGEILIPLACNDNVGDGFENRRSEISFVAPVSGIYYSRVTQSPFAAAKRGYDEGDTTYQYMASSGSYFGGSLHVSVREAMHGQTVTDATVTIYPYNGSTKENIDGIYSFHGIPAGQYQYRVEAAGYQPYIASTSVGEGQNKFVYCALVPEHESNPEGEEETQEIEGEYHDAYGSTLAPQQAHSADYAAPFGKFSVSEILRVIQFLNVGGYGCSAQSEDGFSAAGGDQSCAPHGADFKPQDWKIGLSEALRVIQLYNVDRYAPCEDSEDGFCLYVNF